VTSSDQAFGVYVHWPFCKAKCPYCDFNSHVRHGGVDALRYAKALARELEHTRQEIGPRTVTSIFFGGGTPSLMPPKAVGHVLDAIARNWSIAPEVETTLEANPTSIEAENFKGYRSAGVNRVSVGVQALNDHDLQALGRRHTAEEALAAFRLAARIFPRVSFDMIYARPQQTLEQWREELTRALAEQQGHMSLYQLTIEEGTRFADLHERGALVVPGEDSAADLYDLTQELTANAGLAAYEVSNHATLGHESRHNLLYWRYGEYAGVGPGAHARLQAGVDRRATANEKHPEDWLRRVEETGSSRVEDHRVPPADQASEYLLMGMRISDGIDLDRYEALRGYPMEGPKLAGLKSMGLVKREGSRLYATPDGRKVLNALITALSV
jgi:oxygen-independent coproporphyrinogen-3 oxidase